MKDRKIPKLSEKIEIYESGDFVTSPYNGLKCKLDAVDLSIYDHLRGCTILLGLDKGYDELMKYYDPTHEPTDIVRFDDDNYQNLMSDLRECLEWFKEFNPDVLDLLPNDLFDNLI